MKVRLQSTGMFCKMPKLVKPAVPICFKETEVTCPLAMLVVLSPHLHTVVAHVGFARMLLEAVMGDADPEMYH